MGKRLIALLTVLSMLFSVHILSASALTIDELDQVREQYSAMREELLNSGKEYDIEANVFESESAAPTASASDSTDKQFMADMSTALVARWRLSEKQTDPEDPELFRNVRKKLVESEYRVLSKYEGAQFEDKLLELLASTYLGALANQKTAIEMYWNG